MSISIASWGWHPFGMRSRCLAVSAVARLPPANGWDRSTVEEVRAVTGLGVGASFV